MGTPCIRSAIHPDCRWNLTRQPEVSNCHGQSLDQLQLWQQVAFVEQPETVDFHVTVMGGSTLSGLVPSLKAWLVGFARDSLISMYVMPEHWTYRLDPVSLASYVADFAVCLWLV